MNRYMTYTYLFVIRNYVCYLLQFYLVKTNLRYTFFQAEKASPTLTLSHAELIHIRSALSRSKLEQFDDPDLRAEVEKGNICFQCHKTKFSLLFNRKQQCQLCQRNVCSRCISKVKIQLFNPFFASNFSCDFTKFFFRFFQAKLPEVSNVPVNALSPVSNGHQHEMSLHHHPQPTLRRPSLIEQTTSK